MQLRIKFSKWLFGGVVALLIVAVALPAVPEEKKAPPPKPLKVGIMLPMTGPAAPWGVSVLRATQMQVDDINAAGGIKIANQSYRVELVVGDDKYRGSAAAEEVSRLIYEKGVKYILGPIGSSPTVAIQPIVREAKVLNLCDSITPDALGSDKRYTFRICNTSRQVSYIVWKYVKQYHPEVKTVVVIAQNDATGIAGVEACRVGAESVGVKLISKELFALETTDFYPVASKVVAMKPDAIDATATVLTKAAQVIKALRELGYKGLFVSLTATSAAASLCPLTGNEAAEGLISHNVAPDDPTWPYTEFNKRYKEKFGEWPLIPANFYFCDPLLWLKQAMEATQSLEVDDLVAYFEDLDNEFLLWGTWPGKFGGAQLYGLNHEIFVPVPVSVIRDGKNVIVQEPKLPPLMR